MSARDELTKTIAIAIGKSLATNRPIVSVDEEGSPVVQVSDIAKAVCAAGYAKVDHVEYAADHEHAGLDITDDDGDLFTDLGDIEWTYEGYPNVTLMQRTVGPWMPLEPTAEATA